MLTDDNAEADENVWNIAEQHQLMSNEICFCYRILIIYILNAEVCNCHIMSFSKTSWALPGGGPEVQHDK